MTYWHRLLLAHALTMTVGVSVPLLASAAEANLAAFSPMLVPMTTWLTVFAFVALGWASSSLPILAGWSTGTTEQKYEIARRVIASLCAGIIAYYFARMIDRPETEAFIAAFGGGFLGDKALAWYFPRKDKPDDTR